MAIGTKARRWSMKAGFCLGLIAIGVGSAVRSADPSPAVEPRPVESDMHEFMEYAFQEPYKRLKAGLSAPPANNAAWKVVKSDALLLAEAGNLLLMRGPEDRRAEWAKLSLAVRDAGQELYQAGKAKDFELSGVKWKALLVHCNACHNRFADGEHQLSP